MKRYYGFAGVGLALDLPDGEDFSEGRELPVFACEPRAGMTDVTVRIADRLIMPEGKIRAALPNMTEYDCGDAIVRCFGALSDGADNAGIIAEYRESGIRITMKRSVYRKITASAVLETIGTERLVGMAGGAILHSSFIEVGGKAVLFTAPSGTGKSTQAELWRENRGAVVINGDRSVLRIIDSVPCASGLPYSGSSGICLNRTLPLRAIVYIEQAHENSVTRLHGFAAFRKVWEGVCVNTWDTAQVSRASDIVRKIVTSVPVCLQKCTPDLRAVEALEREDVFFLGR